MRITAELSLYPMGGQPIERILEFIGEFPSDDRLELSVNQMSTQIRGDAADVFERVQAALLRAFASGDPQVLVAKFLNSDLPINEAPDLGPGSR